jgi:hypothetical protein
LQKLKVEGKSSSSSLTSEVWGRMGEKLPLDHGAIPSDLIKASHLFIFGNLHLGTCNQAFLEFSNWIKKY